MSDSNATAEPIVIEAWIADSPKFEDTDENSLPDFGDPLVNAAKSFNRAYPQYEVRIRKIGAHILPEAVADAAAQGNPPDIAEYIYSSTQTALDTRTSRGSRLFVPVERALAGRTTILGERVVIEDLVPTVRQYYSVGGELVSVPTGVSSNILFANKAILDRAGITRMPATWQELTDACAAIAELPDGPVHGVCWPNYGWLCNMEIAGQGGLLSNGANGRSSRSTRVFLDSPEMLNYVQWWKSMRDSGYYHAGEELDYFTAMDLFARQEIAFVVSTSAIGQVMRDAAAGAGLELVAGQLPRHDELSSPGGPVGGLSFFLAADMPKEKEDGALAFLQHQLNPQHAVARMYDRSLPVTLAAYQQAMAEDWAEPFPGFRIAAEQVASANRTPAAAGPIVGNLNGINNVIMQAIEDVLFRAADPASRFRAATEEAQNLLDRYNEAVLAYPPVTPDVLLAG